MTAKPLVAGNWKMNGLKASTQEAVRLIALLKETPANCDVLICPPFTLLTEFHNLFINTVVQLGAQDCHTKKSGAHTGDISAAMIRDCGADFVITGHSERRADHGEKDALVAAKTRAAQTEGLTAIVCVGETKRQRDQEKTLDVVSEQLAQSIPEKTDPEGIIIAYEPVWAIGTGLTPTMDDVAEVHGMVRGGLVERFGDLGNSIRILYGGSVKPANAKELMSVPDVNGALVGGASLEADDFNGIIDAYR